MSVSVTFSSAHRILLASEFFMARRPVVDRKQNLVAHELLFCNIAGEECLPAHDGGDEQPASASVIADVCEHGMSRVIGDLVGILYIGAEALMSDIFRFLPPQKVVLEIEDMPVLETALRERLAALAQAGFRFALVDNGANRVDSPLLPFVEGVRLDIAGKDAAQLSRFCAAYRPLQKKLLAERVDTMDQFHACFELGFDFFQGYYFTQPTLLAGKKLSPSQLAITDLMALIASDADNSVIEEHIKRDVTLGLNLLRLANTPAFSAHRIDSLRQALMVLGRNQLQRWLQVMLYADGGSQGSATMPLLMQATTRGRMMELLAQKLRPGNRSYGDTGFTVGIMSLMDTLFGMSMEDLLGQIPVVEEVADALLRREGFFGKLLSLVECAEWHTRSATPLTQAMREWRLSHNDLYLLQLAAFEWSDQVTRSVH
ncbi:MAG TPA: EAL domain-containing protein [Noviherbaspirillum sp.]|uniref:EAL and HDOD domain-containing protein n=1 Tax=Noviherbaspirillum sp. TaxID=1926288 RepID=UPI002D4E5343|nr:EAL domain-containing protein [Noviherbaspirillum sp.]HYD93904.1 EAL domain-containing protein [Noviherbaspirillum sp.]